ncbi:DUF11 domain-containing protein [Pseudolysinimonas yzui]|uniref:DUF11 domain-containing protein n=1 Tax=Pseudolysinimonas yzui TaxID=2708254 RepID=A0A8J3GSC3_9MICO|nr:DUF11 domain-containing protein [Pseudolysinimonas yzui]GHF25160.1 hypothetical protein GCM10011600_27810 [Pseudolysinimonas yzui]
MTASSAAPARRRGALFALPVLIAGLLAPLALAAPAQAATIGTLQTGFSIDGNKTANAAAAPQAAFDWDNFLSAPAANGSYTFTPTGPYTTAQGYSSTGIIEATFSWDNGTLATACPHPGNDATGFPGNFSPNTNPWTASSANVNNKADGCSSGSAYEVVTDDDDVEHHVLYQYWTRLEGNGDMSTYQILDGGSTGRCDDILVEFNYVSSGPSTVVNILEWTPTTANDCGASSPGAWTVLQANFPHAAAVGVRVEGPGLPGEPETFGEIAVDLTSNALFDEDACTAFTARGYVTRTGNNATAQLQDSVGPGATPLTISNCGTISITKADSPAGSADDTAFGYVITNGGDPVHDDTLAGTDGTDDVADLDDVETSIEGEIGFGETHTWGPVFSGDYAIEEVIPGDAPWTLWSLECTVDGDSYTIVDDGEPVEDAVIPVVVGEATACVLTNATSAITVTKVVDGAETETFGFDLDGDESDSEVDLVGTVAGTTSDPVYYAPGSSVTITELLDAVNDAASDDLDWEITDIQCSDDTEGSAGAVTVTTVAGSTIDCVFTNSQLGQIIVNKVVEGETDDATFDFGGSWTSGTPAIVGGEFGITTSTVGDAIVGSQAFLNVAPGSYDLSELPTTGFDATDLVCVDPDDGTEVDLTALEAEIDLDAGETVSCTYTNTERGIILVDKETLPDEYDQDFSFGFTPDGESTIPFLLNDADDDEGDPWSSGLVPPGTYTVAETVPAHWSLTSISCPVAGETSATVTLEPGAVVTCVFTNTADPGALTLTKSVEGVDPAYAWEFSVDLVASDDSVVTETVDNADPVAEWADLVVGETYTVIEGDLPAGWTAGDIACTGLDDLDPATDGFQFTVTPGLDLECTLLNTADPAGVELEKTVSGVGDDFAWSFEFTLSPDPGSGSAVQTATDGDPTIAWADLTPGVTYTIAETDVPGWTEGAVVCEVDGSGLDDADAQLAGYQFTAEPGLQLDCTAENVADPGSIEITKSTVGGDGSFDFVLQPLDGAGDPVGDPITDSVTTTAGTGTAEFDDLEPGARFSLAEDDPGAEWTPGDLVCTVTAAGEQTAVELDADDFVVAPGDVIACAITNTATATIIVVKNVVGTDGTFDFTGDWLTPDDFEITTDGGTGTRTFDDVLPGSYVLTEVLGSGYDGIDLYCSDEDNTSVDGLTATLGLDPGETLTCTYTNSEWGTLVVDKVTLPDGSEQVFDFEWAPVGEAADDFTLADESDAFSTGTIPPGDYEVSETSTLNGWVLTGLVCSDTADDDTAPVVDGATATVHVALGETVTCTFTNAQRGPLEFDKVVAGGFPVNNGDGTWTIEYDLTVTSTSNVPEDYDLEDELDFGAGIVPLTAGVVSNDGVTVNAGWDGDTDIVVTTGATIPALGTHTYTVTVTAEVDAELDPDAADCEVADGEGSGFLNAGTIEFWSDTDTDDACAELPISDLEITKDAPFSVDFEPAVGPTEFDYTIVVENLGPETAQDAVLEDPIPAGLDFVSATGTGVTCGFAAGVVTCELGDLGVGQTRTVTITVSIPVDYPFDEEATSFQIDNVATTSTITPESDLTNNEDDAETTVLITLPLPPDEPDLPTLALTGAAIGAATQLGLSLLAVGVAFAVMALRRRPRGRHST